MSQDSSKVLKELSMLSTNMDLLVKELKEQNKRTSENTDQIKKLVEEGDKKSTKDQTPKDAQPNEGFFKKLTESFAKQVSENSKSLTENLTKQIAGDFGGIAKNLVKPAEATLDQGNKQGGQIMNAFAKSLLSGIPKLETGGAVNKGGVALVGEKGPELVELKKGNIVNSQDKMAELLKMEEEDMFSAMLARDEKEKKTQSDKGLSEIVSGSPKLGEFVTNAYGVKVPKSEIDKERESLLKEDKEYYDEYPEDLEEDIENFIRSYRETMSVSDIQKLSEKTQPVEIKKSEEELQKAKTDKPEKEKSKLKDFLSSNPLQNLKAKGKDFIGSQKTAFEEKLTEAGLLTKKEKPAEAGKGPAPSKLETEKFDLSSVNVSSIKDLTAKLKSDMEAKSKASSSTSAIEAPSSSEKPSPSETKASTPPVSKETKQVESSASMNQQDLKDIKALLAAIYKSLSGPLNIANDRPFRPNSNVL